MWGKGGGWGKVGEEGLEEVKMLLIDVRKVGSMVFDRVKIELVGEF